MKKETIVISGLPGAGSSTISRLLSKHLNLEHFSAGRLFKDISLGKVKEQYYYPLFSEICKTKGIEIPTMNSNNDSEAVVNLWETEFGKSRKFHEAIDELVVQLANKGGTIIDGKLALYFVKEAGLKIWLTASVEKRAERTSRRDGLKSVQMKNLIQKRQQIEREEWKKIYGFDYFEQEKYADLAIDTTNLNHEQVLSLIKEKYENHS